MEAQAEHMLLSLFPIFDFSCNGILSIIQIPYLKKFLSNPADNFKIFLTVIFL
jgi:hypothetical protein